MFFRSLKRQFSFMFSANDQCTIFILHIEWSQRWCQFAIEMCRCKIRQWSIFFVQVLFTRFVLSHSVSSLSVFFSSWNCILARVVIGMGEFGNLFHREDLYKLIMCTLKKKIYNNTEKWHEAHISPFFQYIQFRLNSFFSQFLTFNFV